jgi:hypothetical protein
VRRGRSEEAALVAVQVGSDLPVRIFMIAALQKVWLELSSLSLLRRGCRRKVGEVKPLHRKGLLLKWHAVLLLSLGTVVVDYHTRLLNPLLKQKLLLLEGKFINLIIVEVARFHGQLIFARLRLLTFDVIKSNLNVGSCAPICLRGPAESLIAISRLASALLL